MPRALLSVHDKSGLVELARDLVSMGWDLVASGGTAKALTEAGVASTSVERVTRHPEMLGGRVKTLHPAIHGGILARDTDSDLAELREQGYAPISLVICNLYPFQQTVAKAGVTPDEVIEQIDIGGVTLLRAAAKNFSRVTVLCDTADYLGVIEQLQASGTVDTITRRRLAAKAFQLTRDYDTAIHAYLADSPAARLDSPSGELPETISIGLHRVETLRYGENPHQQGALYTAEAAAGPLGGTVLGGKTLSYNNLLDLDAAWRTLGSFGEPTVVIVKHLTPCGIGSAPSLSAAFPAALASDPVSAFGGVIAVNRAVDDAFVAALGDLFVEAIVAPEFKPSAQQALTQKRKNCRLLSIEGSGAGQTRGSDGFEYRSVRGGFLVQTLDQGDPIGATWRIVSQRKPTVDEAEALRYAWRAVQHVKSNAIVLALKNATVGIGGGLSSRVDAARIAVEKAGTRARGSVMASDAFFPFADSIEVGIEAGITAIIQPGGSIRDNEVIAAADAARLAMVFTGVRHFRH